MSACRPAKESTRGRSGHTEFCAPCASQLLPSSGTWPSVHRGTCCCGSIPSEPEAAGERPAPRRQPGAVDSAVTQPWLSAAATAPLRQPPVPTSAARCLPSRTAPFSPFVNTTIIQYSRFEAPSRRGAQPRSPRTRLELLGEELAVLVWRLPGST